MLNKTDDNNAHLARDAYRDALELDPTNTALLSALRRIALQHDDVAEAARLLDREQRHTTDPRGRAKLLVELAVLRRDRLDDARGSEHAFEEAHAIDPDNDDAALAIARRHVERSEWSDAARLLDRLARSAVRRPVYEQMELLTQLGNAQLARGEPALAYDAFDTARGLGPVDVDFVASLEASRALWLADLHRAIEREPMNVAHHRVLYRLYEDSGDVDRAYCVASVLVFLDAADSAQRARYTDLRPRGVPQFRARLGRAAWIRDVAHPGLDRAIGGVFEVVARAARMLRVRELRARGRLPSLGGVEREHRDAPRRIAAKAFFGAAAVLGVDAKELWIRPTAPERVSVAPAEEPASVIGSSLLSGWSVPELMFVFGEHLTLHLGEHAVRAHAPSLVELRALLTAATVANPSVRREALMRELREDERQRLAHLVGSIGARADLARWVHCSELTGVRAGLLLCGDLSIAAKIVRHEPSLGSEVTADEKVRELVRFTVSDAYARVRRALGIGVRSRSPSIDDDDEPTRERALCA